MKHSLSILLVEDDFIISLDLQSRLQQMGFNVLPVCASAEEALAVLKQHSADFAIFDVSIRGQTDGIDLAAYVSRTYHIPFVFLTGSTDPAFVERAKKVRPYAYMLKPFNDRELKIAIEIAIANYSAGVDAAPPSASVPTPSPTTDHADERILTPNTDFFFLRKNTKYFKVYYRDILWVEASGNYTDIHTLDGTYLYSGQLNVLEEKLPASDFMRVHRSHIINIKRVDSLEGNLVNIGANAIQISRNVREELVQRLNIL